MSALEKAWEPHTPGVTPAAGILESQGKTSKYALWKMSLWGGVDSPGSTPTLFLAYWEAGTREGSPGLSAAPLEVSRATSRGWFGAAQATVTVGDEDIFRAESGSSFSPSL